MIVRLICYDIGNDALRTRIGKKLEYFGCHRIQKSIFCGELSAGNWSRCEVAIYELFHKREEPGDSIYFINISKPALYNMKAEGDRLDLTKILIRDTVLWI